MSETYDIIIIGSGQNGTHVANELFQQEQKVGLVHLPEKPESAFLLQTGALHEAECPEFPLAASYPQFTGDFKFISKYKVKIGDTEITSKKFVLNCGVWPKVPEIKGHEGPRFFPAEILRQNAAPPHVTILGNGPAAVVTADALAKKKSNVTIISKDNVLLPDHDTTISEACFDILKSRGVDIHMGSEINEVDKTLKNEALVWALGYKPNTKDKGLEKAGVYINQNGYIVTNDEMRTSTPHVWAMGSVTGRPYSVSSEKQHATLVINNITAPFFSKQRMGPDPIPEGIPFSPPIAKLGLTEGEAQAKYKDIFTVTTLFNHNNPNFFIKLIGRKKWKKLLGAHIIGPEANSLILYFDLVLRAQIPLEELGETHHVIEFTAGTGVREIIKEWNQIN